MDKKLQPLNPLQMYGFMPNAQNPADAVALEPCGYSRTRMASWRAFYWGNPIGMLEISSDSYCITKIITILFSSLKIAQNNTGLPHTSRRAALGLSPPRM